jgi:hypothetical protein
MEFVYYGDNVKQQKHTNNKNKKKNRLRSSNRCIQILIHPLVITVAAHKNQGKTVVLCHITHEKNRLVVTAVGTICILGSREGRVVTDGTGHRVQNVPHFLFQVKPIDEWLIRCGFRVSTQSTGVLQTAVTFIFLLDRPCPRRSE